jgi:hypothetical protein
MLDSACLIAGDKTLDSACFDCLARLRGQTIAVAPFLIRLRPCPIAFALDLAALDTEDDVDWSDVHDDFAEDFVELGGMSRVIKVEDPLLTFI